METIRILFYTDSCDVSENRHFWGLTDLESFIKLKLASIAYIQISVLNRHIEYKNGQKRYKYRATKLRKQLLDKFDELWIFGVLQATKDDPELTKAEIRDLTQWMKRGGVFITGDHSDPMGTATCKDSHSSFVNIGSALGRNIPRAGMLRVWDGPPTGCYDGPLSSRDNFNTQEGDDPEKLDNTSLQLDSLPQHIYLIPPDHPHPLFWWYFDESTQQMVAISRFPDHIHEGKLAYPISKGTYWPQGSPVPKLVAQGRDKRFPNKLIDLVSVFAGTKDAGRIVADSSFHHYIDRNLLGIDGRDAQGAPKPHTDLDQIAQYYANLALWLAPRQIRQRLAWSLFFWVAQHPDVREEKANPDELLGRTALRIIMTDIGISNVYRLVQPNHEEPDTDAIADIVGLIFVGKLIVPELNINAAAALGSVIRDYHRSFYTSGVRDPASLERDPNSPELVFRALSIAFENSPELIGELQLRFKAAAAALTI